MSTIVGVAAVDGAVVGADRRTTDGGTVTGDSFRRLVVLDGAGAVAVGDPGAVEAFRQQVEREVRSYRTREDESPSVDRLARVATDAAAAAGVEAIVAARDDRGVALRAITADGGVTEDRVVAYGTGAPVALGHLEDVAEGVDVDAAEEAVRTALARAADRDPETGDEVDVWRLGDAEGDDADADGPVA